MDTGSRSVFDSYRNGRWTGGELALTAFVTLALLEYGEADPDALQKALIT